MKKYIRWTPIILVFSVISFVCIKKLHAAIQYNWGTSTGGSYQTPDDTTNKTNQFLQIGAGSQVIVANSTPTINATTLAVVNASTPTSVGQFVFILDAVSSSLCVSTTTLGSPNGGTVSWIAAISSAAANGKTACK